MLDIKSFFTSWTVEIDLICSNRFKSCNYIKGFSSSLSEAMYLIKPKFCKKLALFFLNIKFNVPFHHFLQFIRIFFEIMKMMILNFLLNINSYFESVHYDFALIFLLFFIKLSVSNWRMADLWLFDSISFQRISFDQDHWIC